MSTEPLPRQSTVRQDLLDQAKVIVSQDRNVDYGSPEENFQTIARLWSEFIDFSLEPHQVAAMLALVKVARIKQSPRKMDHWIDIAGYAACGGEVADNGL